MQQTSPQFKTTSCVVSGMPAAMSMVRKMADDSQWFEFTPFPDDQYEIRVKVENKGRLIRALEAVAPPDVQNGAS